MGFSALVEAGVGLANTLSADFQANVQHLPWILQDGFGKPQYDAPIIRQALVNKQRKLKPNAAGQMVMTIATLTFLVPIAPNGAPKRVEPIDPRDVFILDDGTRGAIVEAGGFEDQNTKQPYVVKVTLGPI